MCVFTRIYVNTIFIEYVLCARTVLALGYTVNYYAIKVQLLFSTVPLHLFFWRGILFPCSWMKILVGSIIPLLTQG